MKQILSILFIAGAFSAFAQPKGKEAKMAPVTQPGYYLSLKGDTMRGEIQTNPEDPTGLYKTFNFRTGSSGKLAEISTKKAKGYGFGGRHFVLVPYDEQTSVYIEMLVNGRLKFYEYKFQGTKDGLPAIENMYYIQDTRAEEKDAVLKELKPISTKFYKKELKPYMKDQPVTWNDLDKFYFNLDNVVKALKDFNKFYEQ
jgi:hypothetical protein